MYIYIYIYTYMYIYIYDDFSTVESTSSVATMTACRTHILYSNSYLV